MLILAGEAGLDSFGEEFEESIDIPIPRPINRRRPEDEERNFMGMGKSKFLPHPFTMAIN
jgi:hypothetical protein